MRFKDAHDAFDDRSSVQRAAERLSILLQAVLNEYEKRFGKVEVLGAPKQ